MKNFKEIMEIIKANCDDVESFLNNDFIIPSSYKDNSPAYSKLLKRDNLYNQLKKLPGWTDKDLKDHHFDKLYEEMTLMDKEKPNVYEGYINEFTTNIGLGIIQEIYHFGGEGEGDTYYDVFYFKDHDIYIRVDGTYSSYNGVEYYNGWESCTEVRPQQKTITVYE